MVNFPAVIAPTELGAALVNDTKVQETQGGGGSAFIKFKFETGEFVFGREDDELTGETILVNTPTISHGWVLWSGGRPKKSYVPFNQNLPMEPEPIGDDYPSEARAFQAALWDDGTMLQFDTSSYGGRKGVDTLLGHIKTKAATGSAYLYPLVKCDSESYASSRRGGKLIFNPVFTVIGWCNENGDTEVDMDEIPFDPDTTEVETEVEEVAPTKRKRRKA